MSQLLKIFDTYKMNPRVAALKSKAWYQQQVTLLAKKNINAKQVLNDNVNLQQSQLIPGSMFVFEYHAAGNGVLPYWDRFPLVIPFGKTKDGFIGLNLHYLQPMLRVQLLDQLIGHATSKNIDEKTKIKFTWQTALAASKHKYIKACVKQYTFSQVKSRFMRVHPENWVGALMLPTETFVGANKAKVWAESRRA